MSLHALTDINNILMLQNYNIRRTILMVVCHTQMCSLLPPPFPEIVMRQEMKRREHGINGDEKKKKKGIMKSILIKEIIL